MKSWGNLYPRICSLENLYAAARKARKHKTRREDVERFELHRERFLRQLHEELVSERWGPGAYRRFEIHDPKTRTISAAPYRDRVVHHAVCQIIEPLWERRFVSESYANRRGKGASAARDHFEKGLRCYPWLLRCDIRKYFPSIDHPILKGLFRRVIRCTRTLELLDLIVDASNEQESAAWCFPGDDLWTPYERRRGLPLGNQASQFFANVYLDPFDHHVKEQWRCPHYVRYVDDLALFGRTREQVEEWWVSLEQMLAKWRLQPHPNKTRLHRSRETIRFLGILFQGGRRRRLPGANVRRMRRRLHKKLLMYRAGEMSRTEIERMWAGWRGHAMEARAEAVVTALVREAQEVLDAGTR